MPPSGSNAKKESGRAKKAAAAAQKAEAAAAEKARQEDKEWEDSGVKGAKKKDALKEKRNADIARKAQNAQLLAEEYSSINVTKGTPTKKVKSAGTDLEATGSPDSLDAPQLDEGQTREVESFAASGIDNALDLLDVVTAKMDKASVGAQASKIEQHPERRFKAALEAYQDRELPNVKKDNPGLRLQQYKELLYKQFQKSPENPFNQTTIAYDASKEEKVEALNRKQTEIKDRLRENKTG